MQFAVVSLDFYLNMMYAFVAIRDYKTRESLTIHNVQSFAG